MCFIQEDKCVQYSGPSDLSIGINQGMKQSEFNAQIVSVLSQILSKLESCNCSNSVRVSLDKDLELTNSVYKAYTPTKCQSDIVNKTLNYSFNGDIFSYDLSGFKNSLPSGFTVQYSRVRISKNNVAIANLSGIASGISLSSDEVPATIKVEVQLNSTCGQILLEKSFTLASSTTTSITLDIQDVGSQYNLKTQADFNDLIYSRLQKLESRI